jgi:hypothetical protein
MSQMPDDLPGAERPHHDNDDPSAWPNDPGKSRNQLLAVFDTINWSEVGDDAIVPFIERRNTGSQFFKIELGDGNTLAYACRIGLGASQLQHGG